MQAPPKPRRPQPDARGLPLARQDIVPGIPKQAPSPRALEAAREAARASSPEVHDLQIESLDGRVTALEARVGDMSASQHRVANSVDKLTEKFGEWELQAAGSENVKIQEEQKTKRWVSLIGLLTMIISPLGAVAGSYLTRETPHTQTQQVIVKSEMQEELDECAKKPREKYAECWRDVTLKHLPQQER